MAAKSSRYFWRAVHPLNAYRMPSKTAKPTRTGMAKRRSLGTEALRLVSNANFQQAPTIPKYTENAAMSTTKYVLCNAMMLSNDSLSSSVAGWPESGIPGSRGMPLLAFGWCLASSTVGKDEVHNENAITRQNIKIHIIAFN